MISGIFIYIMIGLVPAFHTSNQAEMRKFNAKNHRPVVKILMPNNGSIQHWGSEIRYKIRVSDQEDGDSKYQEITPGDVYLKIQYEPNPSKITSDTTNPDKPDPAGLSIIKYSNCSNCHSMKSKVIGPSFTSISEKYSDDQSSVEQIAKHVLNGSSGIWGSVVMPSHPKLTKQEAEAAVSWILKNGSDPDLNYISGLEGVIRLSRPHNATTSGVFILTASYTDHGTKTYPDRRLKGTDVIIIHMK